MKKLKQEMSHSIRYWHPTFVFEMEGRARGKFCTWTR